MSEKEKERHALEKNRVYFKYFYRLNLLFLKIVLNSI